MAFGEHLRADQDVRATVGDGGEVLLPRVFIRDAVAIQAQNSCLGKVLGQNGFDALRALSDRAQVDITALRTVFRRGFDVAAQMATQRAFFLVKHQTRRTARTARHPAARTAMNHRGVATAVDEYQALLAARKPLRDRIFQRFG